MTNRANVLRALAWAGFCLVASPMMGIAQEEPAMETDTLYVIDLQDGSTLYGYIISRGDDALSIRTVAGLNIELEAVLVRSTTEASGRVVDGEYWSEDPNNTRLFFAPSSRPVPNGACYVGTYMILLPFVGCGIGNRFTIAGGAPVLFGELQPFYIAPKLTLIQNESFGVAVGTIAFSNWGAGLWDEDDFETIGIAFGVATFGSDDKALTTGLGFGYAGSDFASDPVLMLGGEARLSRRVKLITENYLIPTGGAIGLVMGGVRLLASNFSGDVGMLGATGAGALACCIPVINFAYRFGGRR